MQEILLNALLACIALAVIIISGKLLFRVLKVVFNFCRAIFIFFTSSNEPNPQAVTLYRGQIVESRNWHDRRNANLHSEFWLRTDENLESRYKLTNTHPHVRRGHSVTLYEYAGHLVVIKNTTTGIDNWVAPDWLLSSLYPTGRFRRFLLCGIGTLASYYFLKSWDNVMSETLITLTLLLFFSITLVSIVKHIISAGSRNRERIAKFSAFCYDSTKLT